MRKILIVCLCCLLMGCAPRRYQFSTVKEPEVIEDTIGWVGEYVKGEVTLEIQRRSNTPNGFEFMMSIDESGFGEFTRFITDDKKTAIYDTQGDGYTLTFTLKDNRVIVEEKGGTGYLETNLSGEYIKK